MTERREKWLPKSAAFIFLMVFAACCTSGSADSESDDDPADERPMVSYSELAGMEDVLKAARQLALLAERDGEVAAMRNVLREIGRSDDVSANIYLAILPRFAMISPDAQAQGAIPLLDSDEERERNAAQHFLALLEGRMLRGYEFYEHVLSDYEDRPPDYFIDYLMGRSPPLALELFADFYGSRHRDPEGKSLTHEAEVARRTLEYNVWMIQHGPSDLENVEAARQALADLLDLDRWWASIFVAEAANHHQQLRTAELGRRLLAVEEPLVRQRLDWARGAGLGADDEIKSEEADQGHGVPPPPRPAPSDDEINSEEADQGVDR